MMRRAVIGFSTMQRSASGPLQLGHAKPSTEKTASGVSDLGFGTTAARHVALPASTPR